MNLPTQHQIAVAGTVAASSAASVIATLGFVHLLNPADAANATAAISQIGDGAAKIMAGAGTLITIAGTLVATIRSSPLVSLFRASKDIAANPALTEQVKASPLADKAPLVILTDKLPEVAGLPTVRTPAGDALAAAVPSATVQPISINPKVI
jgi:hypothetical protein